MLVMYAIVVLSIHNAVLTNSTKKQHQWWCIFHVGNISDGVCNWQGLKHNQKHRVMKLGDPSDTDMTNWLSDIPIYCQLISSRKVLRRCYL